MMLKYNVLIVMILLIAISGVQASIIKFEKGIGWSSYRDLTSADFSKKFKEQKQKGYLIIDVDAYNTSSGIRYAMVWRENKDKRGWAAFRDMSSAEYHKKWEEYKKKGYRPHDIESYRVKNQQRYAGIWIQNKEKYAWSSKRNLTAKEYSNYFKEQSAKGFRIIDMEAYQSSTGPRYAAIWVENKENIKWAQVRDMARDRYQEEINKRSKQGYIVVDYESYKIAKEVYYAAIWEKRSGYAIEVRTNRSKLQFANLWREYRDKGFRLVDFERVGSKYGGIWVENASRYRYSKKKQLDKLVSKYKNDNNLPGISVAVIKDGKSIYRRGFGYADKETKKVAHGGTIYLSASISKAIGGTIAVKLAKEGKMRNGKKVNLDLKKTTSSYLTNIRQSNGNLVSLPSRHTHTIEQICSHIACVAHYEGPEPTTQHYKKAIDALPQIWNADFVSPCTQGSSWNYSTHAFTYVAAVLESVTGSSAAKLIRSELAVPYGFSSMRSLYSTSNVPTNYDRAVPYRDNNTATSFSNNSWKVFGGGIEVSPVDLANFGWKLLDGKIMSASNRDNVLWKRVNPNRSNGIAWSIRTRDGNRRVAEHSGSWTGALTLLRVYRDDGLVIAVMSNRRNHTVGSLGGLTSDIANAVLGN